MSSVSSWQSSSTFGSIMTASATARSRALVLAIALTSRSAEAQVCTGAAPFSNGYVRGGVGFGSTSSGFGSADGEEAAGVHVAVGTPRGPFVSVGASATLYTRPDFRFIREGIAAGGSDDATSSTFSFSGGYRVALSPSRHVELCPIAGLALQDGPRMYLQCTPLARGGTSCDGAVSGVARALWFGGSIGRRLQASPVVAFVPFVGAAYVSSRIDGGERNHTDGYVEVKLGAGLLVNRMTIRPTLSVPLGLKGGTTTVGLLFAVNVGPRSRRAGD